MNRFVTLIAAVFVLGAPLAAQQILPRSLGQWTESASSSRAIAPPQPVLYEYGLSATESVTYASGSQEIQATVFKTKDPSDAYGLYSFMRTPDLARANFTEHSSALRDRALILSGNIVMDVEGQDLAKLGPEIKSLVAAVSSHAEPGPLPTLWEHLPEKGMVDRSDHYILGPQTLNQLFPGNLGDALGFSKGAEAELAHYKLAGHDATLLIADFPTPGFAMQQLAELQKQFNVNGSKRDSNSPPLFAKRNLTLLAIVAGAPTQAEADTLLDQVRSGTQLTWDEPTFQFKEPSIEMMVVGSIVGTGIICGFALVAGFAFGGFRLFMKRIMPGRVFDRASEMQVLQLGLASKPINAEDFYGSVGVVSGGSFVDRNLPDRIALRIFR